ncbi:MAG TPA: UDP-glucose 6-dehydrogenase, partial [Actinobacteria bacterium]|nr:UDP-glucose 6-dehydrogenase [Actinomycetota bacterium]
MQTAVIGAGYVGLVHAAGLAALGHRVKVGERSADKLNQLEAGEVPIYEPDLDRLIAEGTS